MRPSLIALASLLLLAGCDRYPPTASYVVAPPPPAVPPDDLGTSQEMPLTASSAAAVVFLVNDQSTASGTRPGTDARSLDESVVRVLPSERDANVHYGASHYDGRVFVVVGVAPGDTSIEVFEDGESMGTIPVHVLPQQE